MDVTIHAIIHAIPQNAKLTPQLIHRPFFVFKSTLINYNNDYLTGNSINGNAIITTQA